MFLRFSAAALAVLISLAASAPSRAEDARGSVILTVAGEVGNSNRGAADPFHDGFLKFHEKSFDKAFAFDRDMLKALPQQEITANAEAWPAAVKLSGPLLRDVLAAAGAEGKAITAFALDGYGAGMSAQDIAAKDWVLALEADGEPLAIGGRGPLWLAYDIGPDKATAEQEAAWVWSVFYIEAQP